MTKSDVAAAAIEWWRCHRPLAWTLEQHQENPTINTVTDAEKKLAKAVAQYLTE